MRENVRYDVIQLRSLFNDSYWRFCGQHFRCVICACGIASNLIK